MSRNNDRRSGARDDRRHDDDRRGRDRDESRSRRDHGNSMSRPSNGGDRCGSGTGGGGSMHHHGGGGGGGNQQQRIANSFNGQAIAESDLMSDLPKKKFTGRCRLFVGNLPNEVKEEELKALFTPHGDIAECYLSGKGFAFLRLDTRAHAESAKEAIDGRVIHGRQVRVRFAVHGASLRVKELSPTVSNEMLYHAFSHFGDVERAVHVVDEKGRPTGEGIVEFERKPSCTEAIAAIREKVFLLTSCPKPLIVEVLEPRDEDDGLAERMIPRTPQLTKERELGPRFPAQNSFEFVYGMKWKELYEMEKQRRAQLDVELKEARRRLEHDMELAYQDYQAQMLREDLQRRQQELERLEAARRERMGMRGGPGGPGGPGMGPPGGAPQMQQYAQPGYGQGPPMGNPYAGPMGGGGGPMGHGGQPPQQQQQQQHYNQPPPGQQMQQSQGGGPGGPNGPRPSGGGGGSGGSSSNMLEGVQRLLQIFKNEPGPGGPPQANNEYRPVMPQQQPMYGGGGPGGPYGGPGGDYPAEKRMRR